MISKASDGHTGGSTYGHLYEPVDKGSQGGPTNSGAAGPRGGGVLRLKIGSVLHLDGTLDTNGVSGISGAGGGSGGSIWVTTSELKVT